MSIRAAIQAIDLFDARHAQQRLKQLSAQGTGDAGEQHDPRRAGTSRLPDGGWVVPGDLRPDELTEVTQLVVPDDGPYETLGGLVMTALGRIPVVGDEIEVPGVRLRIEQMAGRRVERVRATPTDRSSATETGATS